MDTREAPRAALVVNTRSRSGERAFEHARDRLRGLGVRVEAEYDLHDPARLPETVREAADEYEMVILGGGDGTISSSVDFLAGRETVLGLLPLGTANDFARTLGIPTDLDRACETIASGKLVDIDLGLAGDNYYVNLASVGLSAGVTKALTSRLKRVAGSAAYPLAAIKAFLTHEPFRARLTFPDGDHEPVEHERLLQVAVGNGRFYGGGMVVSPGSGIDDSTLDVYAIRLGRHRDLLGVVRYLKSGDFVRGESVSHYETSRVLVETEPHLPVNVDGELVAQTPQEFSVARNALHVMVPPASTAARYEGPAAKR